MIAATYELAIEIGEMPVVVRTDNADFARMLEDRYGEFVAPEEPHPFAELEIRLMREPGLGTRDLGLGKDKEPGNGIRETGYGKETSDLGLRTSDSDEDVSVRLEAGRWIIERGDFRAEWDPESKRGWVRQTANPYAIDGVLRILHSLILARTGGFLVHGASGVRNGHAFVFAGVSGAGKTTLARLAPPDVTLLTDEISYVREARSEELGARSPEAVPRGAQRGAIIGNRQSAIDNRQFFQAFGTPFAGELARIGEKVQAPLAALFLLKQGPENRIEPVSDADAVRELMRHVLFFAHDQELVGMIFKTVCDFVKSVPVRRLVFTPDARVWELIG